MVSFINDKDNKYIIFIGAISFAIFFNKIAEWKNKTFYFRVSCRSKQLKIQKILDFGQ